MIREHSSAGFTLIEVLVAVLILAVGLLGLAGLQLSGLRSVNNASMSIQATLAVNDIIERMRSNSAAVDANAFADLDTDDIDCDVMPAPYCSQYNNGSTLDQKAAENCTPAQLAVYDVNVWFCGERTGAASRMPGVNTMFPLARAVITCDDNLEPADADPCNNGSSHTISLTWQEQNPDGSDVDGDGEPDETITKNVTMTVVP